MEAIKFDPTVSLGTIIQLIVLVTAVVSMYVKLSNRIVRIETKIGLMYNWWKQQVNAGNGD